MAMTAILDPNAMKKKKKPMEAKDPSQADLSNPRPSASPGLSSMAMQQPGSMSFTKQAGIYNPFSGLGGTNPLLKGIGTLLTQGQGYI